MILIRSLLYNVAFYIVIIAMMIGYSPYFFLSPPHKAWYVPKLWARVNLWLMEKIVGTTYRIEGKENLPSGSYILAPKHQSFWDAFAFLPFIPDALYILKRELTWIPLFGWYIMKMKMVPVNRGSRSKALKAAVKETRRLMAQRPRQLIIYPEGTRRAPGDEPHYKYGIVELYSQLGLPVVPIAHQAGLFWPRRKFLRYPGEIIVRILPPIEPGLDKDTFYQTLIERSETAADEILIETATSGNPPPVPAKARKRLEQLGYGRESNAARIAGAR